MIAYVRSLAPHGFHTFVLLSSHGGNFDALEVAARRLREEFEPKGVRIIEFAGRQALTIAEHPDHRLLEDGTDC